MYSFSNYFLILFLRSLYFFIHISFILESCNRLYLTNGKQEKIFLCCLVSSFIQAKPICSLKTHLESHEIPVTGALNPVKFTDVQLSMHNVQLRKTHQDEILNTVLDTHLPLLRKSHSLEVETEDLNGFPGKNGKVSKALTFMETFDRHKKGEFRAKVKEFFSKNESSCKVRFFMTWISSLSSFSLKEFKTRENSKMMPK